MSSISLADGVAVLNHDCLKNLSCPVKTANLQYFESKLTVYAFGIHSAESRKDTVYSWPEYLAPKNPSSLVSILEHHFATNEEDRKKWLIQFADNTRSQVRSLNLYLCCDSFLL